MLAPAATGSPRDLDRPLERHEQARRRVDGLGHIPDIGEQDAELVTAQACRDIGRPDAASDPVGDGRQEIVAGRVTEAIVDGLEVVEVEEQHGERARRLARGECRRGRLDEPATVGELGQRVVVGLVGQPGLEHAARRHVALEQTDETGQSHQARAARAARSRPPRP